MGRGEMGFMQRSAKLTFRILNAILSLAILSTVLPFARAQQRVDIAGLEQGFRQPPDSSKIMMRWWWFGPSVTKPELEREMRAMKEGGIGGFEVQPVYPLALDDADHGF